MKCSLASKAQSQDELRNAIKQEAGHRSLVMVMYVALPSCVCCLSFRNDLYILKCHSHVHYFELRQLYMKIIV